MEEIKIKYRDYTILYNYISRKWELIKDGRNVYNNQLMSKVKDYADKLDKITIEDLLKQITAIT